MSSEETYGSEMDAVVNIVMKSGKRPVAIHELLRKIEGNGLEKFEYIGVARYELERRINR